MTVAASLSTLDAWCASESGQRSILVDAWAASDWPVGGAYLRGADCPLWLQLDFPDAVPFEVQWWLGGHAALHALDVGSLRHPLVHAGTAEAFGANILQGFVQDVSPVLRLFGGLLTGSPLQLTGRAVQGQLLTIDRVDAPAGWVDPITIGSAYRLASHRLLARTPMARTVALRLGCPEG